MRLTKERLGRGKRERLCVRGVGEGVLRSGWGVEDRGGDRFWSVRVVERLLSAGLVGVWRSELGWKCLPLAGGFERYAI